MRLRSPSAEVSARYRWNGEQMLRAALVRLPLKLLHVPTAPVLVPDAGHVSLVATPPRLVAEVGITLDWFGRPGGLSGPPA